MRLFETSSRLLRAAKFELCGGSDFAGFLGLEEFIEDGAILDHRGA
jgi:hypothetical protein